MATNKTLKTYKNTIKTCIFAGLLLCGTAFMSASVDAQTPREFQNRIERLENEIDTLNRAVYRGEKPAARTGNSNNYSGGGNARANADMEVRLQQFETDLRSLRGRLEEQENTITTLKANQERALSDMQLRLSDLERGQNAGMSGTSTSNFGGNNLGTSNTGTSNIGMNNAAPAVQNGSTAYTRNLPLNQAASSVDASPARRTSLSDDKAAIAYENAFAQLKAGQYEGAGRDFLSFLDAHPDHVLAGNAKYWLGETFYVRGDFDRAARIFAEGYKTYPNSAKTSDNLLKLALSLASMDNTADACVALEQLKSDFASAPSPVTRRGAEEAKRLGCV